MSRISIYIAYHKMGQFVQSSCLYPIHVGKTLATESLPIPGDDSGLSISGKNKTFCELTAVYWAWKNDQVSDYIGLMHYRRFLDLSTSTDRNVSPCGTVDFPQITDALISDLGLTRQNIERYTSQYDVILPAPWDVRGQGFSCLYDEYAAAADHFGKDLDAAEAIIRQLHPDYIESYMRVVKQGSAGYFTNMFIMRRAIFSDYCDWLFSILFALEIAIDTSSYTPSGQRVFGYIAERLCGVYIDRLQKNEPNIRIATVNRAWVANASEPSAKDRSQLRHVRRALWLLWKPIPFPVKRALTPVRQYLRRRFGSGAP